MDSNSSGKFFSFEQDDLLIKSMPIFRELRVRGVFCDVLVKAGNQEFPAHRIILAGTIPYFYTMLTSDYMESKQREIVMKDIDSSILEALIDFSYNGKIKIDHQNVQKLIKAADFFGLDQVKNACANYLESTIQADNVLEIIKLADLLNCQQLTAAADEFITENFSEIAGSKEFLMLGYEELIELFGKDRITCTEETVFEAVMKWVKLDESKRSCFLPEIFSKVRFPLISIGYLVNTICKEPLIYSSNECVRIVDNAKNYHLMQCENKWTTKSRSSPKYNNIVSFTTEKTLKFYDVTQNKWIHEEPLNQERKYSAIASLGSKSYVIGGYGCTDCNIDVYDLKTKKWSKGNNMIHGRTSARATTLNDTIYVCGGKQGLNNLSIVECYSIKENNWKTLAPMTKKQYAMGLTSLNGYIYAIGGFNDDEGSLNTCERYDPKSNTWTKIKPLLQKRHGPGVAALNNKIYVCGGRDGRSSYLKSCEVYDHSINTWSVMAPMNVERYGPTLKAINGKLYAVGGRDGNWNSSVEVYLPNSNSWIMLTDG